MAKLKGEGVDVDYQQLDVTDEASVKAVVAHIDATYGRLDVLVNNAGVFLERKQDSGLFDIDAGLLRNSFEVNTIGPFLCCQLFIPLMQKNDYGRVVNVSTGMAQLSDMNGGSSGYRISKVGLNALTKILSDELSGKNIKINAVNPGWVQTDMGGPNAPLSLEDGVDTIMWLATLRDDGPSGGFFEDCKQIPW